MSRAGAVCAVGVHVCMCVWGYFFVSGIASRDRGKVFLKDIVDKECVKSTCACTYHYTILTKG
jgi:hypothetical protein